MSSFKIFDIAGSGLSAQSVRLNTVASNLANADSVSGSPATVYKALHPVFQAVQQALGSGLSGTFSTGAGSDAAVRVAGIVQSQAPPTVRNDPGNPLADANGNVYSPNVNVIEEMTDMISASRSYQDDVEVMNTAKDLMLATLKLGQ
ncbi:MAG TPA: flagellar basal body rod protein FlgC [Steroidobacteraceae bacterium]|nr:flagellar basal body rod protein FlgC [Steroidobacteraceae bacterium]